MNKPRFTVSTSSPPEMLMTKSDQPKDVVDQGLHEWPFSTRFTLLVISIVAILTRLWYTFGQSITFDEYYEVELAKCTLREIAYRGDGFPPLYSIIMHY